MFQIWEYSYNCPFFLPLSVLINEITPRAFVSRAIGSATRLPYEGDEMLDSGS